MRRMIAVAAVLVGALALSAPAGAQSTVGPRRETASSGAVSATLSYVVRDFSQAANVRLAVTRNGAPAALDGNLDRLCRGCAGAIPVGGLAGSEQTSIAFADLTGDGDPEILVDLYTGGAHCCSVMALYAWDPATSRYRRLARDWGDPGYRIAGRRLVSADDRFAYAFCAYVCSAMPIQVFSYRAFGLVDVTRRFPGQVRADLAGLRGALRQAHRHRDQRFAIKGLLPAICADLLLLRRGPSCRRELSAALRRGELARMPGDLTAGGRGYVRRVLAFLRRTGYR